MWTTCVESCARSSCGAVSEAGRAGAGNDARVNGRCDGDSGASLCAAVWRGMSARVTIASRVTKPSHSGSGCGCGCRRQWSASSSSVLLLLRASASDMADFGCAALALRCSQPRRGDAMCDAVAWAGRGAARRPTGTVGLCGRRGDRKQRHSSVSSAHTHIHTTTRTDVSRRGGRQTTTTDESSKNGIQHRRSQAVCYCELRRQRRAEKSLAFFFVCFRVSLLCLRLAMCCCDSAASPLSMQMRGRKLNQGDQPKTVV